MYVSMVVLTVLCVYYLTVVELSSLNSDFATTANSATVGTVAEFLVVNTKACFSGTVHVHWYDLCITATMHLIFYSYSTTD
jgi:hypothetical protein